VCADVDQPAGLITVLLDKSARFDERDDAASDLAAYDDDQALNALIRIATDATEDYVLLETCGEAIAEIWLRRALFDPAVYALLAKPPTLDFDAIFRTSHPDWQPPSC
jgi:HEAT repeat protein